MMIFKMKLGRFSRKVFFTLSINSKKKLKRIYPVKKKCVLRDQMTNLSLLWFLKFLRNRIK